MKWWYSGNLGLQVLRITDTIRRLAAKIPRTKIRREEYNLTAIQRQRIKAAYKMADQRILKGFALWFWYKINHK